MAKLILKYEDRVLKEVPVATGIVKIGRTPDNTVVIDNPAVSSHHARIFRDADNFILEDLQSTNGTLVNGQLVSRHTLKNGDAIGIGKHTLVFQRADKEEVAAAESGPSAEEPVLPELGGTVFLDTKAQRDLMAKITAQAAEQKAAPGAAPVPKAAAMVQPAAAARVGVLAVLAGKADQSEYRLEAATSIIGKSDTATIKLKGWFKPKVAATITRKGETYVITPLGGSPQVNKQPLKDRYELKDDDILEISGLTLQFSLKG
ncbi:MAG TPA: FHA domain-containing protein [Candidatus Xenobia bacterium]|nr:FHA domain-containing protein [Candidatus Xenobia bacterium]